MNRSYFGRVVGTLVVAAGLTLGVLSGTSSAQVIDSAPKTQVAASQADRVLAQGSAGNYSAGASGYYQCGYYRNVGDAYYTHCGWSAFPKIEVSFMWGWTKRTIQVYGTTNLTRDSRLQGAGMITGARCVADCW